MNDLKKCTKCKIDKNVTDFYKDVRKKDGLKCWCKTCHLEDSKKRESNYNIKGIIYKQISKKNHSSSVYKIYGKKILNLEPIFINFGLQRKTNKFKLIKERYANSTSNTKRFL